MRLKDGQRFHSAACDKVPLREWLVPACHLNRAPCPDSFIMRQTSNSVFPPNNSTLAI